MNRPTVVVLCGSTRFEREYVEAARRETLAGKIVISVGLFGHQEGLDMAGEVKAMLDELHLCKIEMADEILVIDPPAPYCLTCGEFRILATGCSGGCAFAGEMRPYVGESTRREIAYAEGLGKRVRRLSEEGGGPS